jgi:TetR/AcrR family transcriptional regulator
LTPPAELGTIDRPANSLAVAARMMTDGRSRDPEATRLAILEAAERVFVEKGFADAPVSEIAERAGVTKSLIHHHFGSKEGLWAAVKVHLFSEYAELQRRILGELAPDAELLRQSVITYFRFLQKNPSFPRLLHWMHLEEVERQPLDSGAELFHLGTQRIEEAQAKGALRPDVHPFFMLVAFLGLVESWFQSKEHRCHWCDDESQLRSDDAYLDAMLKVFFEGVLPREPGRG